MKAEVKHFKMPKMSWAQPLLGVIFCALLVPCISFLSQAQATNEAGVDDTSYRVVFVIDDNTLDVRSTPGASGSIVGTLAPSAQGIHITGERKMAGSTVWYPIAASRVKGWVAGRYLTQDISPETFCDKELGEFLGTLRKSISEKNGKLLASLVAEDRGLHLYLDAWSKGARLSANQFRTIFADTTKSRWGLGPDDTPIEEGTFFENVLPLLERDLVDATTMSCNTMNHPEVSGPRMLPKGCAGINYISYFRSPGEDEMIQDWGEWVVGIERWNSRWVLSYLSHYQWTP